jgi:hypothetical protein
MVAKNGKANVTVTISEYNECEFKPFIAIYRTDSCTVVVDWLHPRFVKCAI